MIRDNRVWAVLGSGGHTSEMLKIVEQLPEELRPTAFGMGEGDKPEVVKKKSCGFPGQEMRTMESLQALSYSSGLCLSAHGK